DGGDQGAGEGGRGRGCAGALGGSTGAVGRFAGVAADAGRKTEARVGRGTPARAEALAGGGDFRRFVRGGGADGGRGVDASEPANSSPRKRRRRIGAFHGGIRCVGLSWRARGRSARGRATRP